MVNSMEYLQVFGEDTVLPSLPHLASCQLPNSEKLYNQLTKQNNDLVVPSFRPVKSRLVAEKMPMTGKAIADGSTSSPSRPQPATVC